MGQEYGYSEKLMNGINNRNTIRLIDDLNSVQNTGFNPDPRVRQSIDIADKTMWLQKFPFQPFTIN